MVETTKALPVHVVASAVNFQLGIMEAVTCIAVIVEVLFGVKRSESNLKRLIGFPIGTVVIDRALFVFS